MYGTVALCKVKAENIQKMRDSLAGEDINAVDGYIGTDVLVSNNHEDTIVLVVRFRDRASYEKNANDPAQNERYMTWRAMMEADPVWYDGEWERDGD